MKVLFLATNPSIREASTRYRISAYFDALRAAGHTPTLSTFFGERLGSRRRRYLDGFARRANDLLRASDYDVVVVHRELFPLAQNALVRVLGRRVPIVFDFDDAVFLPSGTGWRGLLAAPASTRSLVDAADRVFAGNDYLASWARQSHDRVDVMPTVVDTDVYRPSEPPEDAVPILGWVGSPSTAKYLDPILPIVDELARSFRFRVLIVGAGRTIRLSNVEVEAPAWSAEAEVGQFRSIDIGLYPLANDTWALGKCGFKAIQYMACGVASVVSPVGVVEKIVRSEVDGLWADSPSDWRDAIATLLRSADTRRRLGTEARAHAVRSWSLSATAPRFVSTLESVAARALGHSGASE
ncbi:MAG: glycosyltransferase family 4 protein [Labilithrix sp.]|nr:glycosyltransferase family 4 protein [Labilithrix sp.]